MPTAARLMGAAIVVCRSAKFWLLRLGSGLCSRLKFGRLCSPPRPKNSIRRAGAPTHDLRPVVLVFLDGQPSSSLDVELHIPMLLTPTPRLQLPRDVPREQCSACFEFRVRWGPSSNGTELLGKASFRPPRRADPAQLVRFQALEMPCPGAGNGRHRADDFGAAAARGPWRGYPLPGRPAATVAGPTP
jgi:hypothetical protein